MLKLLKLIYILLSRCLEDRTRIDLSLSEISDEDVNGQMESNRSLENISSPR
jgi:hypothetical protein